MQLTFLKVLKHAHTPKHNVVLPAMAKPQHTDNAYDAFNKVDAAVSKQVYGSDGAASWQNFKSKSTSATSSRGVAPHMPLKRSDRLGGAGFATISDERVHEEGVRRDHGQAKLGSGYTVFEKDKRQKEEDEDGRMAAGAKRKQLVATDDFVLESSGYLAIERRVRPDEDQYFIASKEFSGWKKDYVFANKHWGLGYYWGTYVESNSTPPHLSLIVYLHPTGISFIYILWAYELLHVLLLVIIDIIIFLSYCHIDGMDTVKAKNGIPIGDSSANANNAANGDPSTNNDKSQQPEKKKKKKKKSKSTTGSADIADIGPDPYKQVADAIARRNAALGRSDGPDSINSNDTSVSQHKVDNIAALVEAGWSVATDSGTGRRYYFHNETRKTVWENPLNDQSNSVTVSDDEDALNLAGWSITKDPKSGRTYYYHKSSRETKWDNPLKDRK